MSNIALIVGVDSYDNYNDLAGCEADAEAIELLLKRHDDGSPNFHTRTIVSKQDRVTRSSLRAAIADLFQKKGIDVALFFFAGHGSLNKETGGNVVTQDGEDLDEGVSLSWIISQANGSEAKERVLIFDCCHAGAVDLLFSSKQIIALEPGVSVLAACRDNEVAVERGGRGLFSSLICDALNGGGADVVGNVTVASMYAYVDEVLAGWEQRPLLKANVSRLLAVRKAQPAMPLDRLRKITTLFPEPGYVFPLDPSYEPTALPNHPDHEAAFGTLQAYRAARLLVPNGEDHLYFAAMNSKSCSLTPLGRFYWQRVKAEKV